MEKTRELVNPVQTGANADDQFNEALIPGTEKPGQTHNASQPGSISREIEPHIDAKDATEIAKRVQGRPDDHE